MDVREAVAKAKSYLTSVFAEENISELRLEEVEFDRKDHAWLITLGLSRPSFAGNGASFSPTAQSFSRHRAYKVVRIPESDDEPSIKIRQVGEE